MRIPLTLEHLYNALEQLSREYTNKVDIYTLALVMFEILKKRFDSDFDTWENCVWKIRWNTKNLLKDFQPFEPKKCQQLLEKMFAKDPDECPAAKDTLNSLLAIQEESLVEVATPTILGLMIAGMPSNSGAPSTTENFILKTDHNSVEARTAQIKGNNDLFQQKYCHRMGSSMFQKDIPLIVKHGKSIGLV